MMGRGRGSLPCVTTALLLAGCGVGGESVSGKDCHELWPQVPEARRAEIERAVDRGEKLRPRGPDERGFLSCVRGASKD